MIFGCELTILGYSLCTAYALTQAHSTTPPHFTSLIKMMMYHKTDNSFTNFTICQYINCIIYMALIVTLNISPITMSSGTILRLCKPHNCVKHICPDWQNAYILHPEEWAASFTLCECLEVQHLNRHYQTKDSSSFFLVAAPLPDLST